MKTFKILTLSGLIISSTLFLACQKKSSNDESGAPAPVPTSSTPIYTTENAILQCPAEFRTPVAGYQAQNYYPGSYQPGQPYTQGQPYVNGVPAGAQQNDLTYNFEENINGQICRTGVQQGYSLQDFCQKLVNNSMNMNCAKEQRAQVYVQRCGPCTVVSSNTIPQTGTPGTIQYPQIPAPGATQNPFPGSVQNPAPGQQQNPIPQQQVVQRDPNLSTIRCAISSVDLSGRSWGRTYNKVISLDWNRTQAQSFELPMSYTSSVGSIKLNMTPAAQNEGTMSLQIGAHRAGATDINSRIRVEVQDLKKEINVIADCLVDDLNSTAVGYGRRKSKAYSCDVASSGATNHILVKKGQRASELASSEDGQLSARISYTSKSEFVIEDKISSTKQSIRYVVPSNARLNLGLGQVNTLGQGVFSATCLPSDGLQ